MEINSYEQAVAWLYDRIDYERVRPSGQSNPFRLDRIRMLLQLIGAPHERLRAVHIAGTKGKGSTAALLDSVLRASGYRVGLFTSPHIVCFEERMRVDGRMPNTRQLTTLVAKLAKVLANEQSELTERPPTFFEITTMLAWMFFDQCKVDVVVLETGLGGRLDCTNVCNPLVTMITSIGLDHTHILGDTIGKIAAEKAGIIKPGVPVIQGQLLDEAACVVEEFAAEKQAPLIRLGIEFDVEPMSDSSLVQSEDPNSCEASFRTLTWSQPFVLRDGKTGPMELSVPFVGPHQIRNAGLAAIAALRLRDAGFSGISPASIQGGLAATRWPLRFEVGWYFDRLVALDAAHNADSVSAVIDCLRQSALSQRSMVLIFASSADKDATSMLQLLLPHFQCVVLTRYVGNPRSIAPTELHELAGQLCRETMPVCHVASDPKQALELALSLSDSGDVICGTGSLFLAAELRSLVCSHESPFPVFPSEVE